MRYVSDAPLRSLRGDLGLTSNGAPLIPFASTRGANDSALTATVHTLEEALAKMDAQMKLRAADMETMRADIIDAQTVKPAYMQNIETATVHLIRPYDSCRTICGYEFRGPTYRIQTGMLLVLRLAKRHPWHHYVRAVSAV